MILFTDSFDNYADADIEDMYTQYYDDSGFDPPTIGAYGRRGTNGMRFASTGFIDENNPAALSLVLSTAAYTQTEDTVGIGIACQFTGASFGALNTYNQQTTIASVSPVISTSNGSGSGGNPISCLFYFRQNALTQVAIGLNRDGTLSAFRGSGIDTLGDLEKVAEVLGTTAQALQVNTYNYIECKVKISTTVGTVEIRVNGDVWMALTGLNTQPVTTQPYTNEIVIGHLIQLDTNALSMDVDDYVIWNTDASDPVNTTVDFLGDVELIYLPPTEDVLRGWTPLTGTDHFAMVDEIPPDGDASYNFTSTINAIDTFLCDTATLDSVDILAMTVLYDRRRTTGGNTSTCPVWRVAGTNYLRDAQGDPTTYAYWWGTWTKNPATLGTITVGALAGSSVGYKKVT